MTKSTLIALVVLLFITGFIIAPFLVPDDGSSAADYDGGEGIDLDFHKIKSARSKGGSRSFRGGK